jgi:hypothetical protein
MMNSSHRRTPSSYRVSLWGAVLAVLLSACVAAPGVESTHRIGASVPHTDKPFLDNPDNFQFVVVSDRTGGHRPGVFDQAMDKINLLQPEFVMCVGDLIEGYSEDESVLNAQWDELDSMVDKLQMPFFYTVGNHDVSNDLMRELWLKRNGSDYYHFNYRDVLFISLNTEDPPIVLGEKELAGQARLLKMMAEDPEGTQEMLLKRSKLRVEGGPKPQPSEVAIGEQQLRYVQQVLSDNTEVRWTIVFMHKPAWEADNEQFKQIEEMLSDRPYSVIAGHEHYYSYTRRFGRDYLDLSTTGGVWINQGPGNMDHITWVTMTDKGPVFANIRLDGVMDKHGPRSN